MSDDGWHVLTEVIGDDGTRRVYLDGEFDSGRTLAAAGLSPDDISESGILRWDRPLSENELRTVARALGLGTPTGAGADTRTMIYSNAPARSVNAGEYVVAHGCDIELPNLGDDEVVTILVMGDRSVKVHGAVEGVIAPGIEVTVRSKR